MDYFENGCFLVDYIPMYLVIINICFLIDTDGILWLPQAYIKYDINNEAYICTEPEVRASEDESLQLAGPSSEKSTWSYNETLALIDVVESKYDDLHHPKRRKTIWNVIAEELISQNIQVNINNKASIFFYRHIS